MENKKPGSRAEEAMDEIGRTDSQKSAGIFLAGVLLFIFCLPLIALFSASARERMLKTISEAGKILPTTKDVQYIVTHQEEAPLLRQRILNVNNRICKQLAQFDSNVSAESYLTKRLHPRTQYFLTKHLGQGNEKVLCGEDKWIFYKPDIEHLTGPGFLEERTMKKRCRELDDMMRPVQPDPVQSISEFHSMLKKRGIELILLPTPVKAMIYPEKLSSINKNSSFLPQNRSYEEFLKKLSELGITAIDARQLLLDKKSEGTLVYSTQDTHWTPEGMKATAIGLANAIRRMDPDICGKKLYSTRTRNIENFGDTLRILKLPECQSIYPKETVTIQEVIDDDEKYWQADNDAEVLLLGDSFSNIFSMKSLKWGEHAGLAEQLSFQLQSPVDAILQNDAASYATIERLNKDLRQGRDRLKGKKVVIWQFIVRELTFGNWKTGYDWSPPDEQTLQMASMPQGKSKVIVKVIKKSPVPNPATSDYPDCLYAYKAEVYKHISGAKTPAVIMVNSWAFKDSSYSDTSKINEGDFLEIETEPMASASPDLKKIMVSDNINDIRTRTYLEIKQARSGVVDKTYEAPTFTAVSHDLPSPAVLEAKRAFVFSPEATRDKQERIAADIRAIEETISQYGGAAEWIKTLQPFQAALKKVQSEHTKECGNKTTFVGAKNFLFCANRSKFLINKNWQAAVLSGDQNSNELLYPIAYESILQTRDWLSKRGIDLIVVPIPTRAEIYADLMTGTKTIPHVAPHRLLFNKQLLNSGIEVVDLTPYFLEARLNEDLQSPRALYCKDDPHWDTEGIKIAAKIVAKRLKRYKFKQPSEQFRITEIQRDSHHDLFNHLHDDLKDERYKQIKTVEEIYTSENSLFKADPDSPILVCGDSYVVMHDGGSISAHLSKEMGLRVDLLSQAGGGPLVPKLLASSPPAYINNKSVVIWCFVVRYFPAKEWLLLDSEKSNLKKH